MTATVYYTFFILSVVFTCQAQILPGGVPLFHGGFVGQPLKLQNSFNRAPGPVGVPLSQQYFTRGSPVMSSIVHRVPMTALKVGTSPGLGMIPLNTIGTALRTTGAKENTKDEKAANAKPAVEKKIEAILEEMKKEAQKTEQKHEGKTADSIDPVDQETDEIPKQVLSSSGSFSDGSRSPFPPKTRSPENGEGIPDLDYLAKAANPIDDFEKKIEKTAKKIGHEIKHAFTNLPKLFQGRAEGIQNEEGSATYNNDQSEMNMGEPVQSSGLKKAMDDFQKTLAKSQMMQRYYGNQKSDDYDGNQHSSTVYSDGKDADSAGRYHGNEKSDGYDGSQHSSDGYSHGKEVDSAGRYYGHQKSDGYYANQHSSDVDSHGKEADSARKFWDSVAKNVAESLIKGGQSRAEQTESGASSGSRQENNPMSTFFNSASKSAGNFADAMQNYGNADYKMPSYENGIPAHLWKSVSEYVNKYAKNFGNPEQQENNDFSGTLHRQYGYGYGGYPGYYENGYNGHHGHHEQHGYGSHYPYYPGSHQNGYYPRPGWQYGSGYYKRSPVEIENSTVPRNPRGLPIASDSSAVVAETVFDLVRSIMDGNPRKIAHASVDMGSEIVDATSDSDMYKRTIVEKPENSTSPRNARQMSEVTPPAQSGGITNSAVMLAQSILARRPDQIANAGINMGSDIAGTVNAGQRFLKRSDSVGAEDSSSSRSPRQMLPILPLPGLMSPVQTGLASTALNFAQGFAGANPKQGVIQPIVGGLGTSTGNLAQELGFIHNQPSTIQGMPVNQMRQIASSAVNLAQGITQIAGAANNSGVQTPRFFKRSDPAGAVNDPSARTFRQIPLLSQGWLQPAGTVTNSALNLAQSILSGNPSQIANSGINMGTGIAGTGVANPTQGLPTNQFGQIAGSAMNLAQGIVSNSPDQIVNSGVNMGSGIATSRFFKKSDSTEPQNATTTKNLRQIPLLSQGWVQPAGTVTNSALNLAQSILSRNPGQIANSGINMGTGIAGTGLENPTQGLPSNQFGQIASSAMNLAQGIVSNSPDQIVNSGVNMGSGIATSRFFKKSDSTEPQNATTTRNLRQIPLLSQGWVQPAGTVTNSALNLAQSILSRNPGQIANSGVNMGTGIAGATNGAVFNGPRFFKRSSSTESQNVTSTRILRQIPTMPQGWVQPAGTVTNSALNLAQSILSGNPDRIANSGVNMGTGIAGATNGAVFNRSKFFKRSSQGSIWQSATGLAGSIANSANVDPSRIGTEDVMGTAVGATKEGGSASPSDLVWESISDLAGNIAKVTEKPSLLGKTLTLSNSSVKTTIKSPNQLINIGHSQVLGAPNPSGEITNSAITLAGRIASILMNPNVFNNPNLDATDGKSKNPLLTPVYLAGDIVGVALNPEAYRNVRMVKTYAPTQTGGYVKTSVPAVPTSLQQQSATP